MAARDRGPTRLPRHVRGIHGQARGRVALLRPVRRQPLEEPSPHDPRRASVSGGAGHSHVHDEGLQGLRRRNGGALSLHDRHPPRAHAVGARFSVRAPRRGPGRWCLGSVDLPSGSYHRIEHLGCRRRRDRGNLRRVCAGVSRRPGLPQRSRLRAAASRHHARCRLARPRPAALFTPRCCVVDDSFDAGRSRSGCHPPCVRCGTLGPLVARRTEWKERRALGPLGTLEALASR